MINISFADNSSGLQFHFMSFGFIRFSTQKYVALCWFVITHIKITSVYKFNLQSLASELVRASSQSHSWLPTVWRKIQRKNAFVLRKELWMVKPHTRITNFLPTRTFISLSLISIQVLSIYFSIVIIVIPFYI